MNSLDSGKNFKMEVELKIKNSGGLS